MNQLNTDSRRKLKKNKERRLPTFAKWIIRGFEDTCPCDTSDMDTLLLRFLCELLPTLLFDHLLLCFLRPHLELLLVLFLLLFPLLFLGFESFRFPAAPPPVEGGRVLVIGWQGLYFRRLDELSGVVSLENDVKHRILG
jgi:hypothetical protein